MPPIVPGTRAPSVRSAPSRRRPRRSEHGAAALEFALVVPVLIMLVMGIVTGGITFSRGIALTDGRAPGSAPPVTRPCRRRGPVT